MHEVFERENITLPQAYKDLDLICYPSPTVEDGNLGFISDLKSFFNPSTVEPPLPNSLIPIEKGDTPAPVGEDFLDLEVVELSGSGSGSDSSSEESDVDMTQIKALSCPMDKWSNHLGLSEGKVAVPEHHRNLSKFHS
jgi:hypothetical protein